MKIEEYGYFCLEYRNSKERLLYKNNFISLEKSLHVSETPISGSLMSISINDSEISVINLSQEVRVNGIMQTSPLFTVKESDSITINEKSLQLLFVANSNDKLDELLDMFLDGTLPDYFDVQKMFVEYAINKRITNKQAAFILASIDVPELDVNV